MEESVRKSFEGFELPVSDTDWSRIAEALDKQPSRRGFWLIFRRYFMVPVLIIFLGGIAITTWLVNKTGDAVTASTTLKTNRTGSGTLDPGAAEPKASGEANHNIASAKSSTAAEDDHDDPRSASTSSGASRMKHGREAASRNTSEAAVTNKSGNKEILDFPEPESEMPEIRETGFRKIAEIPGSFGIRLYSWLTEPGRAAGFPLELKRLNKSPLTPPGPKPAFSYYLSMQTTYDPGKVSFIPGTGIWEGFDWLNGRNPALNLRLEGGIEMGSDKLTFTAGAGLEGNPLQTRAKDTIRIQVADRWIPYMDQNGTILYYLAVRWRDSVVVLHNNPKQLWGEIPLGVHYRFGTSGDRPWKFTAGLTLNPGVMLGSRAEIANPYRWQAGSYWDYNYGIKNADTVSAIIDAGEFINPLRLGSGLQLGVAKDLKHLNIGLQVQTRYYFTPVWKNTVPLKQNTLQYGINVRLGFKI